MDLVKGGLTMNKNNADWSYALKMMEFKADIAAQAEIEMRNEVLTQTRYMAVFKGHVSWKEGEKDGIISRYGGLKWNKSFRRPVTLPTRVDIDGPNDGKNIFLDGQEQATVPFRWSSKSMTPEYQLQISDHREFATRVYDRANIKLASIDVPLGAGSYFWRIRGFSKENVPGPFSKIYSFKVMDGFQADNPQVETAEQKPAPSEPGPPLRNIDVRVISTMVIVSGATAEDARVNVNGVAAVMMEAGKFRAIINFEVEGKQTLRITATNPETSAETVVDKTVKIAF